MKRITERDRYGKAVLTSWGSIEDMIERLADYEDTSLDPCEIVELVEVVRCKDCTHYDPKLALRKGGVWCAYWGVDPDPNDFCSYGERREGNGD